MKLQLKMAYWLESALFRPEQTPIRKNRIIDYDVIRLQRIERLREYAREYASQSKDMSKLIQANRLLTRITEKLNNKFHHCNLHNMN